MIILIKTILLISLLLILFQDIKQRQVWVILLPIFAIMGSVLFYYSAITVFFLYSILINLALVGFLIVINYLFAKFILKKSLFKEALGLGDVLFFIGFALSFPTFSFINFFVFSLLFSLVLQMVLKLFSKGRNQINKDAINTIPLAGYMAIFLIAVYNCHWLGFYPSIYIM